VGRGALTVELDAGWRAVAERLERELDVNIAGAGAVWLPVVAAGPPLHSIERRIAQASLTFQP